MTGSRAFRLSGKVGAAAAMLLLSVGCPTSPPPRRPEPKVVDDNEPEQTAEWLFVTSEGQGARGKKAECEKVASWMEGEKACTGYLCSHARDLGREWLQRCPKLVPDQKELVEDLVEKAAQRAELPDDACVRQGNGLLRDPSCADVKECTEAAQAWVSKCGERYATPLMVLMVTRTLERKLGEDAQLELDTRSCETMGKQISEFYACEAEDKCQAGADTAVAWQSRCMGGEGGVPIVLAFQAADVLVGGGKGVDPIPVDPSAKAIPDGTFPLMLEDNRGAVTWVCGQRPKNLAEYIAVRKGCAPGEVIMAHLDKSHRVRTASVPHATDAEFARLFPFLRVKGEQEARDADALEGFTKALTEAAEDSEAKRGDKAFKKLATAMIPRVWAIANQAMYQKAVASLDARLEYAFRSWGRAKAKAADRIRKDDDFAIFVGRALASPLADMTPDGTVTPGAFATPAGFHLATWMPRSVHAYRKELERAAKRAERRPVSDSRLVELRVGLNTDMTACAAAMKEVSDAEQASSDCLFGGEVCAEARSAELSSAADAARQRAQAARVRVDAILGSGAFDAGEVARIEADRVARGCLDP